MTKPEKEAGDILDPILATFRARLQAMVGAHAVTAYLRGSAQMIEYGRTILTDRPVFFEGPPMQQAIAYANKHCAQLVTNMDIETKDRLAKVIGDAIQNKRGVDGLGRDIRAEFEDMSRARSQVIARTETCDALEQSFMDRSKAIGITGKEWITHDPCPICAANEAEGIVPLSHVFSSGHDRPPVHPNCVCALAPVML